MSLICACGFPVASPGNVRSNFGTLRRSSQKVPTWGEESMDVMDPLTYDFSFSAYAKKNHWSCDTAVVCSPTEKKLGSGCKKQTQFTCSCFVWAGWRWILYIDMCVFVSDVLYLAISWYIVVFQVSFISANCFKPTLECSWMRPPRQPVWNPGVQRAFWMLEGVIVTRFMYHMFMPL